MEDTLDIVLRLGAAILGGAAIGLDRDMHSKPSGVRLHALVALGAALFVMSGNGLMDGAGLARIIQGIVGGIGFLGAGVIMHGAGSIRSRAGTDADERSAEAAQTRRRALQIHHLTTASSIWLTAGLGVACGLAQWRLAIVATAGALIVLYVGIRIDRALFGRLGREDEGGDPVE